MICVFQLSASEIESISPHFNVLISSWAIVSFTFSLFAGDIEESDEAGTYFFVLRLEVPLIFS